MIQLYIYIYPLFFRFFSHIGHYRVLSRVMCAIQQVLISYLFYIIVYYSYLFILQQYVYVNPNLPVYLPPPPQAVFFFFNYYYYLFIYLFIYLFFYFWLCWVFVSVRGLSLVVASGDHSSLRCAGLSLLRPLLLRSTGSRRAGSVVVAHGPSRSTACGIFPDQGSNPCPLHWQADSQPLRHQGSPPGCIFKAVQKFSSTGLCPQTSNCQI